MSLADELRKLRELYEEGSLTEDEYEQAKQRVLSEGVQERSGTPWFFWVSLVLTFGVAAAFFGLLGSRDSWWASGLLGLYLLALLYLARVVVLVLFGRTRALHFTRRRAVPGWLTVLLAVLALVSLTLLREGFFPTLLRWDFNLNYSSNSLNTSTNQNAQVSHGGPRTPLRNLPVAVFLPDDSRSYIAEGFNEPLNPPAIPNVPWRADVNVRLQAPSSWACTPLFKWGRVAYQVVVQLDLALADDAGLGHHHDQRRDPPDGRGHLLLGEFNYKIGRAVGQHATQQINQYLANN